MDSIRRSIRKETLMELGKKRILVRNADDLGAMCRSTSAAGMRFGGSDGFAQVDGRLEMPGESRTRKIIVKPCAGKRHARV